MEGGRVVRRESNEKEGEEEGNKESGFQMEKICNDESRIYGGCVWQWCVWGVSA